MGQFLNLIFIGQPIGKIHLEPEIPKVKISVRINSQHDHTICQMSIHKHDYNMISSHYASINSQLLYFALCTISTVIACAIKTDEICIFCSKSAQNFVLPGTRSIWHCTVPIKFSISAYWVVLWQNLQFKSKNWFRLIQQVGLLARKFNTSL